jgi:hypothetical protein
MKTIFRSTIIGLIMAVGLALGAAAVVAQSPCDDVDGKAALDKSFRDNYGGDLAARKKAVEAGKQYIEKYGACEDSADFVKYLKDYLPGMEKRIKDDEARLYKQQLYNRFDASVKASNFDETYASGKEILMGEPEQLDVIITLGSIGYDEAYKGNFKYNTETMNYARQAIGMLNAGKTSKTFGLFNSWSYKSKDNALGWMNLTIGYLTKVGNKDIRGALPYLFKAATMTGSDTSKNPI